MNKVVMEQQMIETAEIVIASIMFRELYHQLGSDLDSYANTIRSWAREFVDSLKHDGETYDREAFMAEAELFTDNKYADWYAENVK